MPSHRSTVPRTLRILIVDDDPDVREADALRLRRLGHEATVCADPARALESIATHPHRYHLILTDQVMPDITGLDLARKLRKQGSTTPIVIMSGYSADLTVENLEAAGVQATLRKPFGTDELAATVDTVVSARSGGTPKGW